MELELIEIIREMNTLPKGSLVYKKIKGKEQPYLQWTENGKTKSKYIKVGEREKVFGELKRRSFLKNEFDRVSRQILKEDDYFYVSDSGSTYNALNEQPLISKKDKSNSFSVERNYINSKAYHDKFEKLPVNKELQNVLYKQTGRLLEFIDGLPDDEMEKERLLAVNGRTGEFLVDNFDREAEVYRTGFNDEEMKKINECEDSVIIIHNHSHNGRPSAKDIITYYESDKIKLSLIACHDGDLYCILWVNELFIDIYNELLEIEKSKTMDIEVAKRRATTQIYELNDSVSERHKFFKVLRM